VLISRLRNKGIIRKKIIPVLSMLLLGCYFISLSTIGTIVFIIEWYVYSHLESFIILTLIIIFAIGGTMFIYVGFKWILKNESTPE